MRPRDFAALGVLVREAFLDAPLLLAVRDVIDADKGAPVEVLTTAAGLAVSTEVRRAWEVALPDSLEDALLGRLERLRLELEQWCGRPLQPCQSLAALRYPAGAFYRTHRDATDEPDEHGLHRRAVSIVIFLNSGAGPDAEFTGGALRLHDLVSGIDDGLDVEPEAGTLVAFVSSLLHEVTTVEWGERQSLVTWLMADDM
jgi:predicted 2-oxoglutarate/Fe(II)-dependent dioxygenase YbiX